MNNKLLKTPIYMETIALIFQIYLWPYHKDAQILRNIMNLIKIIIKDMQDH